MVQLHHPVEGAIKMVAQGNGMMSASRLSQVVLQVQFTPAGSGMNINRLRMSNRRPCHLQSQTSLSYRRDSAGEGEVAAWEGLPPIHIMCRRCTLYRYCKSRLTLSRELFLFIQCTHGRCTCLLFLRTEMELKVPAPLVRLLLSCLL